MWLANKNDNLAADVLSRVPGVSCLSLPYRSLRPTPSAADPAPSNSLSIDGAHPDDGSLSRGDV